MSNYPAGAEFDPDAPYNQEDAKLGSWQVSVSVWVNAYAYEHAVEQIIDMMTAAKIADDDFGIEWVRKE